MIGNGRQGHGFFEKKDCIMDQYLKFFVFFSLGFVSQFSFGQAKQRLLPSNINQPSINYFAPFISGDGQSMIYLSDYTDDGHHSMRYATKKTVSTWNDAVEVTKLINRPTLNFRGGYCLSFDGDMMIFTSRKAGLGGFELWYSYRRGNDWEAPKNFGAPINSRENEGGPALSPDGEYLYFMRCAEMSEYGGANGCRIVASKKTSRGWSGPKDLPANINTGNSQTPRILADGQTMIFASDRMGGKGKLDLFMTQKQEDGSWTDPVPWDFLNTGKNDQFVSLDAKGRYAYMAENTGRNSQLVMKLVPSEFKPAKVMRIKGEVVDALSGQPVNATLTVFQIDDRNRLWNDKIGNRGEFAIVLKEGTTYDLSVSVEDPAYMYYSKVYNLERIGARDKQTLKIEMRPIEVGGPMKTAISFEEHQAKLTDNSTFELRRIANMMRKNPGLRLQVTSYLDLYKEDSIQSDPDLTELRTDSVYVERQVEVASDTILYETTASRYPDHQETDSAYYDLDSLSMPGDSVRYETIRELQIKYTYHNDRTLKEAEAVKAYLVGRGVEEDRVEVETVVNKEAEWDPGSGSVEEEDKEGLEVDNRWIEIKVLEM